MKNSIPANDRMAVNLKKQGCGGALIYD